MRQRIGISLCLLLGATRLTAQEPLKLSLSVDKHSFFVAEPFRVWLTYTNEGKVALRVPAGLNNPPLRIHDSTGRNYKYGGEVAQFSPRYDGSLVLQAGEQRSIAIDMGTEYGVYREGTYAVSAWVEGTEAFRRFHEKELTVLVLNGPHTSDVV